MKQGEASGRPWHAGPVMLALWQRGPGASLALSQARHAQTVALALLAARGIARPVVWVPAFYAVSAMAPLQAAAVELRYYAMTPSLTPDWQQLEAMAREVPPQLLIFAHFYGMEADGATARAFADRHGALLLEDAAHSMLPAGEIGRHGHLTCYSPRKYYNSGDGAVLVANGTALATELEAVAAGLQSAPGRHRIRFTDWRDRNLPWRHRRGPLPPINFDYDWGGKPGASPSVWMSERAHQRIERLGATGAEAIRAREVATCVAIELHVEAATPLKALPRLPEVAPYLLGFRGRTREETEVGLRTLREAGAVADTWPDIPRIVREQPERYGAALELRNTILRVTPRFVERRFPLDFMDNLPVATT